MFPALGSPAPWPAGLTNQDGAPVALADFRGQHVLLYFYPKDDTPGCTVEACNFRDHLAQFPKLVILGASLDDAVAHRAFREKFHLPFDLIVDHHDALATAYGTLPDGANYPSRSSFLIGLDGLIKAVWPKVDAKTHWNDVLQALT